MEKQARQWVGLAIGAATLGVTILGVCSRPDEPSQQIVNVNVSNDANQQQRSGDVNALPDADSSGTAGSTPDAAGETARSTARPTSMGVADTVRVLVETPLRPRPDELAGTLRKTRVGEVLVVGEAIPEPGWLAVRDEAGRSGYVRSRDVEAF